MLHWARHTGTRTRHIGSMIIDFIGKCLSNELKKELEETDFFSILMDDSTDASIVEKIAIFTVIFDQKWIKQL